MKLVECVPNFSEGRDKEKIAAFIGIREGKKYNHLASVYIYPKYRNKGYATMLIKKAKKDYSLPLTLVCYEKMKSFYSRLGFKRTKGLFKGRIFIYNILLKPFIKKELIAMKSN